MDTPTIVAVVALASSIFAILIAVLGASSTQSARNDAHLARIERKLDRVLTHLSIEEPDTIPDDIRQQLLAGDKIKAIKLYRQAHGIGLREAKDAVEEMMETM